MTDDLRHLSADEIDLLVNLGMTFALAGELLTIYFTNGQREIWTLLPAGMPLTGLETMRFEGRDYLAPPREGGNC